MDPYRRRPDRQHPEQFLPHSTGPAASTGSLLALPNEGRSRPTSRNVSPASSRRAWQPATPVAEGEGNTEYFPNLEVSPSLRPTHSTQDVAASRTYSNAPDDQQPPLTRPRQPSIRLRRRSSSAKSGGRPSSVTSETLGVAGPGGSSGGRDVGSAASAGESSSTGRPRSSSQPERGSAPQDAGTARHSRRAPPVAMPRLTEEGARPTMEELGFDNAPLSPARSLPETTMSQTREEPDLAAGDAGPHRLHRMRNLSSRIFRTGRRPQQQPVELDEAPAEGRDDGGGPSSYPSQQEYDERLVDYLDTIDPEVQTLSTLTNVQNSLFIPDLGKWVNRRPTYSLTEHDIEQQLGRPSSAVGTMRELPEERVAGPGIEVEGEDDETRPRLERTSTITSRLTESHYAALPHGTTLDGWTAEEKSELDDHVRHMLHSRRAKFKRMMKGFGQYVRRPLGFFVTLYATLITLFGLAWVLFLIGWIYVEGRQKYLIHIIDSVLVALFAIMGDGLAPFRAVDTYHMAFVVHYARIVKKGGVRPRSRLQKRSVPPEVRQSMEAAAVTAKPTPEPEPEPEPELSPEEPSRVRLDNGDAGSEHSNDPHTMRNNIVDAEDTKSGIEAYEDTPLTYAQQKSLYHHQKKLAKSHSFYKPHETATHYAFPLKYLIAVVILLDCHSCLQISLGACTWGIDYHSRPFAVTTVILCVSITCNITAGIVISIGDRKTRKKDVWKLMNRQELTSDAIKEIEEKRNASTNKLDKTTSASDAETQQSRDSRGSNKLIKKTTPAPVLEGKEY